LTAYWIKILINKMSQKFKNWMKCLHYHSQLVPNFNLISFVILKNYTKMNHFKHKNSKNKKIKFFDLMIIRLLINFTTILLMNLIEFRFLVKIFFRIKQWLISINNKLLILALNINLSLFLDTKIKHCLFPKKIKAN